mmetsp:Transcript_32595/g.52963  ORF Transcript_32595/g.52963 Transcript_32595/m.52963 type:complete len:290 (-) Transcript_32595:117-986(-)
MGSGLGSAVLVCTIMVSSCPSTTASQAVTTARFQPMTGTVQQPTSAYSHQGKPEGGRYERFYDFVRKRIGEQPMIYNGSLLLGQIYVGGRVICAICNMTKISMHAFHNHVQIFHVEGIYRCVHCKNRTFTRKTNMINHMKLHQSVRPFRCTYCNASFTTKQIMQSHAMRHTGELPFNCTRCSRKFRQRGTLIAHIRTHTKIRPFECQQCSRAFTELSNLRLHACIHTGSQPFVCQICNRRFNRKHNLNRHLGTHSNIQPFQCSYCGRRFAQKITWQRHNARHQRAQKNA